MQNHLNKQQNAATMKSHIEKNLQNTIMHINWLKIITKNGGGKKCGVENI